MCVCTSIQENDGWDRIVKREILSSLVPTSLTPWHSLFAVWQWWKLVVQEAGNETRFWQQTHSLLFYVHPINSHLCYEYEQYLFLGNTDLSIASAPSRLPSNLFCTLTLALQSIVYIHVSKGMYHSLAKECPQSECLTSLPKRGVGALVVCTRQCMTYTWNPRWEVNNDFLFPKSARKDGA